MNKSTNTKPTSETKHLQTTVNQPTTRMTKITKKTKRKNKVKGKKSTKTKSKSNRSKDTIENVGAPEMVELENFDQPQLKDQSDEEVEPEPISLTIVSKVMKVQHENLADKRIKKLQRQFNKAKKNGSQEAIDEAELNLNEEKAEKEEATNWIHPKAALEHLSEILEQQIQNKQEDHIIQATETHILDAEESLKMIQNNMEEAMYYKILINNQDQNGDIQNSDGIRESNDEDQFHIKTLPNLPPIQNQEPYLDNENDRFTQQMQEVENDINDIIMEDKVNSDWKNNSINKITNYITPMKSKLDREQEREGELTPKTGTKTTPINIIQQKLKDALKVLSPQEKMEKIRQKARENALKMKNMTLESKNAKEPQKKKKVENETKKSTLEKQEAKKKRKENKVKKIVTRKERSELKEAMSKITQKEKRNKKSNTDSDQSRNSESGNDNHSDSDTTDSNTSNNENNGCLLYTSPSPRDRQKSRMPSSA